MAMWRRHFLVCWLPSTSQPGGTCWMLGVMGSTTPCSSMAYPSACTRRRNTAGASTIFIPVNIRNTHIFSVLISRQFLSSCNLVFFKTKIQSYSTPFLSPKMTLLHRRVWHSRDEAGHCGHLAGGVYCGGPPAGWHESKASGLRPR